MTHARSIRGNQRMFLDKLNQVLSEHYWERDELDPFDHWTSSLFGSYEKQSRAPKMRYPFLRLAAKFGVCKYLQEEVSNWAAYDSACGPSPEDRPLPLLSHAIENLCSRDPSLFPLTGPRVVRVLLDRENPLHLDVNYRYKENETDQMTTPWLFLLRTLRIAYRKGLMVAYDWSSQGTHRWGMILIQFIQAGADVKAVIEGDAWGPRMTPFELLEMLRSALGSSPLWEATEMVNRRLVEGVALSRGTKRRRSSRLSMNEGGVVSIGLDCWQVVKQKQGGTDAIPDIVI